jgi:hypothetical protein
MDTLVPTFEQGMQELVDLHAKTGVGETGEYLPPEKDRQVGLGILGLANFLAQNGISYKELADALEPCQLARTKADEFVEKLNLAIYRASAIARSNGFDRAFCIAPTASCSYQNVDLRGYTTTPELAPPTGRQVDRDSGTFGVQSYDYPPDCEIASEVGWETYRRVADGIVSLFKKTGLFHGYSFNSWSDIVTYDDEFLRWWLRGPQTSLYYALQVMPDTQRKDHALAALDEEYREFFQFDESEDEEEASIVCPIQPTEEGFCSACAE